MKMLSLAFRQDENFKDKVSIRNKPEFLSVFGFFLDTLTRLSMDDMQFYILFNSISVISGRWADDCNGTPFTIKKMLASRGARTRDRKVSRLVFNPLS